MVSTLTNKEPKYVRYMMDDGKIITGQNPASSEGIAKKLVALFHHNAFI